MTTLTGVVLLAARNLRARAYAEALRAAGLAPAHVIVFGRPASAPVSAGAPGDLPPGLFRPRLDMAIEDLAAAEDWPRTELDAPSVNDPAVLTALRGQAPRLVVYAGLGGELVGESLLAVAPVLHLHSGWLPRYRGSTTLYYAILEAGRCACSALLLDPDIDTGAVLARRHYPLPAAADVDHRYDGAIRADLLVRVLRHYQRHGALPRPRPQSARGRAFYVIHPVLKHIARLKLEQGVRPGGGGE